MPTHVYSHDGYVYIITIYYIHVYQLMALVANVCTMRVGFTTVVDIPHSTSVEVALSILYIISIL
jgi:hypothetical protein